MNSVLIISYDLVQPSQNYEQLLQLIKTYPSWARLGGSTYLIFTDKTPVQVRDTLVKVLNRGDKLFVGVASAPAAWAGMPEEVSKWILHNQKSTT